MRSDSRRYRTALWVIIMFVKSGSKEVRLSVINSGVRPTHWSCFISKRVERMQGEECHLLRWMCINLDFHLKQALHGTISACNDVAINNKNKCVWSTQSWWEVQSCSGQLHRFVVLYSHVMYLWDADWLNNLIRFRYVGSTKCCDWSGMQGNKVIFCKHHCVLLFSNQRPISNLWNVVVTLTINGIYLLHN